MIQKASDNFFYELNDDRKPANLWDVNFQFYKHVNPEPEALERFEQVKARFSACDEMFAVLEELVHGDANHLGHPSWIFEQALAALTKARGIE